MLGMRFTHCAHSYWYHHFVKYKPPFPIQQMYFKKKRKKCCLSLNKIRILTEDSFLIYCWFCLFCILQFLLPHPLHTLVFTSIFFYPSLLREIIRNFPEIILTFSMLLSFFFFKNTIFYYYYYYKFFLNSLGEGGKNIIWVFVLYSLSSAPPPPNIILQLTRRSFLLYIANCILDSISSPTCNFEKKKKKEKTSLISEDLTDKTLFLISQLLLLLFL